MPQEEQVKTAEESTETTPIKEESVAPIPDKEVKPETIDTDSKTESTSSDGEYTEEKKVAMGHMKSYYGEDVEINDLNYYQKMEEMVSKDYGPTKEKNTKYETANKNVQAMMHDNPEMGGVLADMGKGAKAGQVLNKYFDLQAIIDSGGGDDDMYEENNKARTANYEKYQAHLKTLTDNEEKSFAVIEEFKKEKKLEGENADKFGNWIADAIEAANMGNITKDFLERMYYAMNYESDVADAKKIGEISTKNAAIDEKMKSEEELQLGDGTPRIESANEEIDKGVGSGDELADKMEKSIGKNKKRRF